jgi:localization factor PodJL
MDEIMRKAAPWSIDGIKPDIREAAREAARRQGLSLSAWLNDIIVTQAAELGIDADEMDSDERLEAVAARLHQLDERDVRQTPSMRAQSRAQRDDRWRGHADEGYEPVSSEPGRERPIREQLMHERPTQERTKTERPLMERLRAQEAEALLEAAIGAFEHSIAKSQKQTARSFEAVAQRLTDIELHLTQRPQDDGTKPIRSALARLEERLDSFTQAPPPAPPRDDAGLKRLESKLDALLSGSALSTQRPVAKQEWRNSLQSAVAEIGRKQQLLNGEASDRRPLARRFDRQPASTHAADLQALQRDIAALGVKLEEMRLQDLAKDLTRMRTDIGTMSAGMADLAPRDSVTAIESAIRNLTTRIETSREDGMRETLLKPITELVDGLRNSLGSIDPHPSIDGLGREIKTISDRLEAMAGQPHEPAQLGRVQAQIQEIHGLLTAAASHPFSFEEIERKVAALSEQMERQKGLGPMPSDEEFLSPRLQQTQVDSLAKIEDRLDDLSRKIETAVVGRPAAGSKMDAESLEAVVKVLADKFTAAQDPRAGQAAFESLQGQIAELARRLEQTDSGFSALPALQRSVNELFTHLDETRFAAHEAAQSAARNAAHEAVREVMEHKDLIAGNASEEPAITREIADLRAVQDEAGRRTHSTLNAVHETLEKIVDRLAMLEEEMGEAREVAAQEQRLSEQNAIFARYRGNEMASSQSASAQPGSREPRPADDKRPAPTPTTDFLIEPGTLFPNANEASTEIHSADGAVSDPARSRADFIAAARRAAQAAQADHEMARPRIPIGGPKDTTPSAGIITQARDFLTNHKRQLTLSIAALFLAVGAYAVIRTMSHSSTDVSSNTANAAVHGMTESRLDPHADRKAGPRGQTNDIALNIPQRQMPRDVTPALPGDSSPGPKPNPPAPNPEAPPSGLPLMAIGGGAQPQPQRPIAGSDPIVTGAITASKTVAPAPESPATAQALRELADAGNAAAQYELATRYAEGRLMPRDFKLAADWYEKAAVRGLGPAQYRLGSLYEKGIGVTRDLARAKDWYEKAANQGHSHAMHNLAVLIAEGGDGKPDYATAAIWFRKAAELGIRDSQYNLAILYARGLGVQQDLVQSYKWFAVAATQGDEDAGKKREDVAAKLDAKALADAKAAVDSFQPREADHAANEVQTPPGGWEAAAPAQALPKLAKPKISRL